MDLIIKKELNKLKEENCSGCQNPYVSLKHHTCYETYYDIGYINEILVNLLNKKVISSDEFDDLYIAWYG